MNSFNDKVRKHAEHVKNVATHCLTEETTKHAMILPFLDILGFSPFDPTKVKAEYAADFPGAKSSERVDYALFCHDVPVMFIEAKGCNENLNKHDGQLSRYFNATPEVVIAAITNGREWRFFTDLSKKNIMDEAPFLVVDFQNLDVGVIPRLARFKYDEFQPDALRTLAEESMYIDAFKDVIIQGLRDTHIDFVRYVATAAKIERQFNVKFLESITPLVRQAVEGAISTMVVSGLSSKDTAQPTQSPQDAPKAQEPESPQDIVDPSNPKIVTTQAELSILATVQEILGDEVQLSKNDTESYFSVLLGNKTTRWLLRYYGDKKTPSVEFQVEMTEERRRDVERAGLKIGSGGHVLLPKPQDLMRIVGLLRDSLEFCQNDDNFKRTTSKNSDQIPQQS